MPATLTTPGYDIIPDLHADLGRLTRTLAALGYAPVEGVWRHPEGRIAAFLGDYIDPLAKASPGAQHDSRGVTALVRAMVADGMAVALMGNHELNALLFHTPGQNKDGISSDFMRAHTPKNVEQHAGFLREYEGREAEKQEVLDWFLSLPLYLDLGHLRLVHACWDEASIAVLQARRPDARLCREDLQEIALEQSAFARAVNTVLKGPEVPLPEDWSYLDQQGHRRHEIRLKWWGPQAQTWRAAALSVPNPEHLPEGEIAGEVRAALYPDTAPPVIVGHYKQEGPPAGWETTNALSLDFPLAPCAYRWTGEAVLSRDHLLVVDLLERAIEIAVSAHRGQRDKAGQPYILHSLRVMQACSRGPAQIVGVLHDVVEDTGWTPERLRAEGFGEEVLEPLSRVTKLTDNEPYDAFIQRAAPDPVAREVKMADLRDNMDLSRIAEPTERDYKRLEKYEVALETLSRRLMT